jgi:phenylacetate-CoA ligase
LIRRLAWRVLRARHAPGWRASFEVASRLSSGPRETFRSWRDAALAEHLAWAAATIPFHRERVARGTGLAGFPVLTRADVQAHREALRDPSRPQSALRAEASGGSTGEPVRLWRDDAAAAAAFATEVLVLRWWGLEPWCRQAVLWGDDRVRAADTLRKRVANRVSGVLHLNAFAMDDARMAEFAARAERHRPEYVMGYATALDLFAGFLRRAARWRVRPRVVRSAAEALSPAARARIEAVFGCPVRDFYGSRESPALAAQCASGGFHVLAHGRVVEVVDEAGAPCPPGVPGRVLVTDLENRAFGLVRYENGDVASLAPEDEPCACRCPYPRLERVLGRTSDFVTTPSRERIHGEWFTHLFYGREGVRRFRVRQPSLERVEVETVGEADEAALAPLLRAMRERLGPEVTVAWRRVDDLPLGRSGKHRFTVSDVPFP